MVRCHICLEICTRKQRTKQDEGATACWVQGGPHKMQHFKKNRKNRIKEAKRQTGWHHDSSISKRKECVTRGETHTIVCFLPSSSNSTINAFLKMSIYFENLSLNKQNKPQNQNRNGTQRGDFR